MYVALEKRQDKQGTNQLISGEHFKQKCEIAVKLLWQIQQLFLLSHCIFRLQTDFMAESFVTGITALGTLGEERRLEVP